MLFWLRFQLHRMIICPYHFRYCCTSSALNKWQMNFEMSFTVQRDIIYMRELYRLWAIYIVAKHIIVEMQAHPESHRTSISFLLVVVETLLKQWIVSICWWDITPHTYAIRKHNNQDKNGLWNRISINHIMESPQSNSHLFYTDG